MPLLQLLLLAQLSSPRATYDGQQLYFQLGNSIHRIIETGEVQPFAEDASNPQVTLSGIQVAFAKSDNTVSVVGARSFEATANAIQMSGNGRYLLVGNRVVDLDTNLSQNIEAKPKSVASNGTILLDDGSLWQEPALPFRSTGDTTLSDNGEILLYEKTVVTGLGKFTEHWLYSYNRLSRQSELFFMPGSLGQFPRVLAISATGTTALVLSTSSGTSPGTAYIAAAGMAGQRIRIDEPVLDGTLSGDGQMAFLVTQSQRLIRLNRFTGEITTLFALQ